MSVPNQKIVCIGKRKVRDRNNIYATVNIEALRYATQHLDGSGFKLWLYFNKNQAGFQFELSQKACEEWGIKRSSYYKAMRELESKGFLKRSKDGSNIYTFYEMPLSIMQKENKMENSFSGNKTISIEKQNNKDENWNNYSEIKQRNNTYSTDILQDSIWEPEVPIKRTTDMDRLGF